ncbi:phage tail protein [Pseudomonas sp. SBB6]|uniref:phage tail protein n=1 Tax=Pseudomonas sp. SBB6 TaxID=2962032 RepID=UPI0020B6B923|nr:phage tail protein [Pseudomonas sp. SBB6]MCP3749616.1 phage tail protein [Pseudomonas sp. SBB6]
MTDQTSQFFAILTAVGEAKQANANALGVPWTFAQMGVGDANLTDPIPSRDQKKLINERRRAPLNQVKVDPDNASVIIAEQVIPPDVGGWWIREIGLYDADGDLVAVANCAPSFKPLLNQGTGKTQVVRLNIIVTSTANVQLKIDPAVVLATREYVDSLILSVLPPNKTVGTFTKVRTNERGIVQEGFNPTTLAGYGIVDAIPNLNPLPGGSLDVHAGLYGFLSSVSESVLAQNCYFNGVDWVRHNPNATAICIAASNGNLFIRRSKAGTNPIVWETTSTALDTSNIEFSHLHQLPQTLAGYGITDAVNTMDKASQAEAEAGVSSSKWMTPKGVFQAIYKAVIQATETVLGVAKVATQAMVNAGVDDTTFVTPKKLRWGFLMSIGSSGFIVFPEFLGGLVVQWGGLFVSGGSQGSDITMPLAFPNAGYGLWPMWAQVVQVTDTAPTFMGSFLDKTKYRIFTNQALGNYGVVWFAIGK